MGILKKLIFLPVSHSVLSFCFLLSVSADPDKAYNCIEIMPPDPGRSEGNSSVPVPVSSSIISPIGKLLNILGTKTLTVSPATGTSFPFSMVVAVTVTVFMLSTSDRVIFRTTSLKVSVKGSYYGQQNSDVHKMTFCYIFFKMINLPEDPHQNDKKTGS